MGRIITLEQARTLSDPVLRHWAYNVLDTTGTLEIHQVLAPHLTPATARTYAFERALQGPALSMMLRGVRVDVVKRDEMIAELRRELAKDERAIGKMEIINEVWDATELETGQCKQHATGGHHKWPRGEPDATRTCERCGQARTIPKPFEANSSAQAKRLFYDLFQVPAEHNKEGEITCDDDALERIGRKHPRYRPVTDAIRAVRDKRKQLGSLSARLTSDGRYPSSFNVGAAWTGRFSSSKNPFGEGGNLQNVAPRHRRVFLPDPGMDIGYADYMQGESNLVAHLAGDPKYIEAHALGDVHTYVTRLVWPELPWTGDLKADKKIAKTLPQWDAVEGHDWRFQAKRIQHGSNYGLTPMGISMIAHIPLAQARRAYERYMSTFDYIPAWQRWVLGQVKEHRPLVNPLGRTITLFGRPWDIHTWRQALAFLAQSALADIEDIALYRTWWELETEGVELLAQVHDALLHQYPRDRIDLVKRLVGLMTFPVPVTDYRGNTRLMTIGVEAAVGRNWGHVSDDNPMGIKEIA